MNDLDLSAYIDDRLPAAQRDLVEAHLAECAACRENMLSSRRLIRASRRPRRNLIAVGALIAAGVVTFMILPALPDGASRGASTMRDAGDTPALVAYGPSGETPPAKPLRASWAPAPGATLYRFTLATADGAPIWNASVTDTSLAIPDSVTLRNDTRYVWMVDALLGTGATRSTGLREFQLSP